MAAPSNTVWGSAVGGYGRIGIHVSLSSTATDTTATVDIWFWSKYTVSDNANNLYYNQTATASSATTNRGAVNINTTVASGEGWSTSNQVKIKTFSNTIARRASATTMHAYAKLADVDRVGGTMYASTTFTIPALPTYTVTYNANGGRSVPAAQTKTYGVNLTLSTQKPTRAGHTFQGWATSASATTAAYAAGATYSANAAVTLYAVWKAQTYTVTYNANGGSGAPAAQTKTYGVTLKLSSTIPTRTRYVFKGWALSATATAATYAAGANFTDNVNQTLYAVWELDYTAPVIYSLVASRCNAEGTAQEDGTYAKITFKWNSDYSATKIMVVIGPNSYTVSQTGTSGTVSQIYGEFSPDQTFEVEVAVQDIAVHDSYGITSAYTTLPGAVFPFDALAGGTGVAFGKPAELGKKDTLASKAKAQTGTGVDGKGVAEFGFDAKFNEPVYGNVFGLNRLPAIPEGAELNDYMETGCWAIHSNAIAATITCGGKLLGTDDTVPPARACRLEINAATGEGIRLQQWSYLRQRFIPYNSSNATWERDIARGADNVWIFYDWWMSSLTPIAAQKVYNKAAATIAMNANATLGVVNVYTKIPFDKLVLSTSDRLTLENNSIRIGKNISHVKVSGQLTVKCNTAGNRHARIQKVSGSTTTSCAWDCIYGVATFHAHCPFTPIIIPVKEGDLLNVVVYTPDATDYSVSGSSGNGYQSYLTVEEL